MFEARTESLTIRWIYAIPELFGENFDETCADFMKVCNSTHHTQSYGSETGRCDQASCTDGGG
jgi:hypothetical protein